MRRAFEQPGPTGVSWRVGFLYSEASMKRLTWAGGLLIAAAIVGAPATASAQIDQLIGVNAGGFFPTNANGRDAQDVLAINLDTFSYDPIFAADGTPLGKDVRDAFRNGTFGGEYLLGLGDWVEAGVGVSYYQKSVDSVYTDYTFPDGADIAQRFKLRMVPVTVSARFFPIGRTVPVQPYVGGGINIYKWKYTESGSFIDFSNPNANPLPIFTANPPFEDEGTAVGPVFLAGVRVPFAHNHFLVGGEFRWQGGTADLDPSQEFAGTKLDLSGVGVVATFHVRF